MTELSPIAIKRLRNEGNNIRKLNREILEQEVRLNIKKLINVCFNNYFRDLKSILTKQSRTNGGSECSISIKIQKFIKTSNHSQKPIK